MKLQFCSDLHLEFAVNREWLRARPLQVAGQVLVIAGDTYYLEEDYSQLDFIRWASDHFEQVYLIPGNHEYYGGYDVATALGPMREDILPNVCLLNNTTVEWGGTHLIFSTLWSEIRRHPLAVQRSMNDFHKIRFGDKALSIAQFNQLHAAAFNFLAKAVQKTGPKVVVTHHLPSNRCNIPAFQNSLLNEAFCVEKTSFIQQHDIAYWIYGHSHRNLGDFQINHTTLLTNQLGYVSLNEHQSFDDAKVIDLASIPGE